MGSYVLVHGMGHGGWCWAATHEELARRGHDVVAVDLALTSLDDDAAIVSAAVDAIDEPVTLVGHSYGGLVISRAAAGRSDVQHLVYVAAVMLDEDDVLLTRVAEFPSSALSERARFLDDGTVVVEAEGAVEAFYNECDGDQAREAAARLRPTAVACLATPPGAAPWRSVPSTYVRCERDQAIHPDLQRWMSHRAGRVVVLDTDHSPFLSTPGELTDVIEEAGAAVDPWR